MTTTWIKVLDVSLEVNGKKVGFIKEWTGEIVDAPKKPRRKKKPLALPAQISPAPKEKP